MPLSNYDKSASLNTLVGGVSIAEGMLRADVNNALRAMCADLADFYQDEFTDAVGLTPETYGAVGDGVTDDTTALAAMFAVSGAKEFVLKNTYLISNTLTPPTGCKITGLGSGKVLISTANTAAFNLVSKSRIRFYDLIIESTVAGANAYIGGIVFDTCSYCVVRGCNIIGFQWAGVYLANSTYCRIKDNYFGTMLGTVSDACDIQVYYNSTDNIIEGNHCFGGRVVGINVQDPGGAGTYLPARNVVRNNIIGAHTGYGINIYVGSASNVRNSDNIVDGNYIEGITGAADSATKGSGIYCVGHGLGGLRVVNNRIHNCCTATTSVSNAPAGISIAGFGASAGVTGGVKPVVQGNSVSGMSQAHGIAVTSVYSGCAIGPNSVEMPSTNSGAGAGGGTLLGVALSINTSNQVDVTGGSYVNLGTSDAILVNAASSDISDISITGVHAKSAAYMLRATRSSTYRIARMVVNGINGSGAAAFSLDALDYGSINGVSGITTATYAAEIYRCVTTTFSNNTLNGGSNFALFTSGTCTGSNVGLSNVLTGKVENGGTGLIVTRYGTAAPGTGTAAVGDHIVNSAPAAAGNPGWYCTTAGSPGTFKAEAAIAA